MENEIIKGNKEVCLASLNSLLDNIYNIKSTFFNEDNSLKEGLEKDVKTENFLRTIINDVPHYEAIRRKIIDKKFNFDDYETTRVGMSLYFSSEKMKKEKETLEKAIEEVEKLSNLLLDEAVKNNLNFANQYRK